ncbi:uncharacterized protein L199_003921 [Kwoniella botswanensis]|uniref:uncharacterized protein n=1 Tax=Kwoniella botswanensis TaxID=1268659 RepID=UPI00315DE6C1
MPLLSLLSTIKVKPKHKRTYPLGDSGGTPIQILKLRGGCASASNLADYEVIIHIYGRSMMLTVPRKARRREGRREGKG